MKALFLNTYKGIVHDKEFSVMEIPKILAYSLFDLSIMQ